MIWKRVVDIFNVIKNRKMRNFFIRGRAENYVLEELCDFSVSALDATEFLNYDIIAFLLKYLEKNVVKDHHDVLFVQPSVVQFIKLVPSEARSILESLETLGKQLIFFPINDNDSTNFQAGDSDGYRGQHWSLLMYSQTASTVTTRATMPTAQPRWNSFKGSSYFRSRRGCWSASSSTT